MNYSDKQLIELGFSNLMQYVLLNFPGYEPGYHHRQIVAKLEAVERGEITRLMLFLPPRHGKSALASEYFPPWYLGRNPDHQIIHATYAQEFAEDFGRKVRNTVSSPLFKRLFNTRLAGDSSSAKRFYTDKKGVYHAVGVDAGATGKGAHLLIIDDPVKNREDADSETKRRKLKDWFRSVAYTRLMPGGAIVIIQTRWHEDDLSGWLLSEHEAEGWDVLSMPAISDEGQALWPESFPLERLLEIKAVLGSREWQALYQQRPTPAEGGMIKSGWLERTRYKAKPARPTRIIQSWDTAYKAKQINDPSVCTTWLETSAGYYLLDVFVVRAEYPAIKRAVVSQYEKFKPNAVLIEDKSSGISLLQELRRETRISVIAISPENDKVTRMNAVSALFEAGRVWLPESAPWLVDYESELFSFPLSKNDDQVDSTSQALAWMDGGTIKTGAVVVGNRRF